MDISKALINSRLALMLAITASSATAATGKPNIDRIARDL